MANLGQNLVEQQYELENVPMQRLVQMAQQPDGLFPQYLVLTELERRNRYKQAYDAEKASMVGDTTVAQDLVNESASAPPAGINTLGPSSSLSNQVNPAGGIAQAGPQMMASGGAVRRYKKGGGTLSDDEINYIASTALGVIEGPGDYFQYKYPEQHNLVFGQGDDQLNWLDNIGDVNQFEALLRSFSEKDLQREDLNKINQRLFDLELKADIPYDRQEFELNRNLFKFDTNQAYLDDYYSQFYPFAEDREGLASLLSERSEEDYFNTDKEYYLSDEYQKKWTERENLLDKYRGEENLASQDKYYREEYPILEEALRKKIDEKEEEFFNEGATGEVVRVESMIPNLISRTDASGTAIDYIRSIYPDKGDHQIEEIWSNLSKERKSEINNMLEKDFHLHGGPLINPSTGRPDWWNTDAEPFKEGGLTSLDTSIPKPTREQIAKAREMYPDADYETILDIAAGIDTMDITTNENRYKTGGIARFNQGRNIPYIGVSSMAGPYMPDPYYMKGPDDLPGADKYIQEENAQNARARANQIIADLEAQYGVGNIPLSEYKKVEDILKEADLYDDIIEKRKVEEYEKQLEEQAEAKKYGVKTKEIVKPQSVIEAEEKEAALVEKSDELDVEDSDYIADQVERYAGILGLPSKEERERNKTTSLLFGLGSAISQATQPGDIAKGFPGIQKMLVAEDRQASKDRLGILNLLATQDKRQTLSRKDRLTIIQNRIEDLRKELEQPAITGGRTPEDIQEEIRQLSAIINAATGVGPQTSGNILKAKSYVGG